MSLPRLLRVHGSELARSPNLNVDPGAVAGSRGVCTAMHNARQVTGNTHT